MNVMYLIRRSNENKEKGKKERGKKKSGQEVQVTLWHDRYTHNTHLPQTRKEISLEKEKDTRNGNRVVSSKNGRKWMDRDWTFVLGAQSQRPERRGPEHALDFCYFILFSFDMYIELERERKENKITKILKMYKKKEKERAISAGCVTAAQHGNNHFIECTIITWFVR